MNNFTGCNIKSMAQSIAEGQVNKYDTDDLTSRFGVSDAASTWKVASLWYKLQDEEVKDKEVPDKQCHLWLGGGKAPNECQFAYKSNAK